MRFGPFGNTPHPLSERPRIHCRNDIVSNQGVRKHYSLLHNLSCRRYEAILCCETSPPLAATFGEAIRPSIPVLGIIVPEMGTVASAGTSVADALFTSTQQRVLGILFGHPERSFFANEIFAQAGTGRG